MQEILQKRINELLDQCNGLYAEREILVNRQKDIDVRLTQLIGAVDELSKLLNQVSQPSEPQELLETQVSAFDGQDNQYKP